MDDKAVFLICTEDGKLKKTDNLTEADYVRVPAKQYITVNAWNNIIDKYKSLRDLLKKASPDGHIIGSADEIAVIPREEYNGFQKLLRVIRDRSLQQIEKSKADPRGYTLKYADLRIYDRSHPDLKAYLITKITPISLKLDLEMAYFILMKDLKEFFNYIDPLVIASSKDNKIKIQVIDLITAIAQRDDPSYSQDFYRYNSETGKALKTFLDSSPKILSFGPVKIISNYGQGVYEVSYWASEPI